MAGAALSEGYGRFCDRSNAARESETEREKKDKAKEEIRRTTEERKQNKKEDT